MDLFKSDNLNNQSPEKTDETTDKGDQVQNPCRLGIGYDPKGPCKPLLVPSKDNQAYMQDQGDRIKLKDNKQGGGNNQGQKNRAQVKVAEYEFTGLYEAIGHDQKLPE